VFSVLPGTPGGSRAELAGPQASRRLPGGANALEEPRLGGRFWRLGFGMRPSVRGTAILANVYFSMQNLAGRIADVGQGSKNRFVSVNRFGRGKTAQAELPLWFDGWTMDS